MLRPIYTDCYIPCQLDDPQAIECSMTATYHAASTYIKRATLNEAIEYTDANPSASIYVKINPANDWPGQRVDLIQIISKEAKQFDKDTGLTTTPWEFTQAAICFTPKTALI